MFENGRFKSSTEYHYGGNSTTIDTFRLKYLDIIVPFGPQATIIPLSFLNVSQCRHYTDKNNIMLLCYCKPNLEHGKRVKFKINSTECFESTIYIRRRRSHLPPHYLSTLFSTNFSSGSLLNLSRTSAGPRSITYQPLHGLNVSN